MVVIIRCNTNKQQEVKSYSIYHNNILHYRFVMHEKTYQLDFLYFDKNRNVYTDSYEEMFNYASLKFSDNVTIFDKFKHIIFNNILLMKTNPSFDASILSEIHETLSCYEYLNGHDNYHLVDMMTDYFVQDKTEEYDLEFNLYYEKDSHFFKIQSVYLQDEDCSVIDNAYLHDFGLRKGIQLFDKSITPLSVSVLSKLITLKEKNYHQYLAELTGYLDDNDTAHQSVLNDILVLI